jgi:hypothetical protein
LKVYSFFWYLPVSWSNVGLACCSSTSITVSRAWYQRGVRNAVEPVLYETGSPMLKGSKRVHSYLHSKTYEGSYIGWTESSCHSMLQMAWGGGWKALQYGDCITNSAWVLMAPRMRLSSLFCL